eukprot:COSAG06_NODE_3468_length_5299_cov_16.617885_4_plen_466_part_00
MGRSLLRCAVLAMSMVVATMSQSFIIPSVSDTHACEWNELVSKIAAVDSTCCPGGCDGGVTCTVPCAEVLLPLLDDCRPVLDLLFDGNDGALDGVASQLDDIYDSCMAIPQPAVLQALAAFQASGQCTDEQLDGIAETEVAEAPCTDVRDGCATLVKVMSCAVDFAPGGALAGQCDLTCHICAGPTPAPCADLRDACEATIATGYVSCETDFSPLGPMAGQCGESPARFFRPPVPRTTTNSQLSIDASADSTCHFCNGRHRLQSTTPCDLQGFAEDVALVDAACCDDGGSCGSGVPTTCDVQCALAFRPFYDRCSAILAVQIDTLSTAAYDQLYATCSTGLPVEPLLRTAAACAAAPIPPPPPAWYFGHPFQSCDTVCSDAGRSCSDGDWGIHSEESFRAALVAVGQDWMSVCRGAGRGFQQSNSWEGFPSTCSGCSRGCVYATAGQQSECSASASSRSRLCRCL